MFRTKSHNWWFVKLGHFPCGSIDTVALWPPMIISCGFCRGGLRCQRHVTSQHHLWSTVIWCQLLKGKTSNGFAERVGLSFVFQFWICRCFCSLPCFLMRKLLGRQFHGKRKKVIGKTQVAKQGGASSSDVIYLAGKAAKALAWPTRYNWQQKVLQHGVWLLSQLCHRTFTSNCVCSHQFKIHLSCLPIRTCPHVIAFSVWKDTSYMIVKMMWAYCWCWSDSYQKMFPLPSSGTWLLSEESSGFYSTWRRGRSPLASTLLGGGEGFLWLPSQAPLLSSSATRPASIQPCAGEMQLCTTSRHWTHGWRHQAKRIIVLPLAPSACSVREMILKKKMFAQFAISQFLGFMLLSWNYAFISEMNGKAQFFTRPHLLHFV